MMNSVVDIEPQNLQDCWTLLYFSTARKLTEFYGQEGKRLIRRAVHRYGSEVGALERKAHVEKRIGTSLKSFYELPVIRYDDPRFRLDVQRLDEQEALFDVVTCPFREMVRFRGPAFFRNVEEGRELALCFCEEFTYACIEAYTEGVGQANLSEILDRRGENSCRFADYLRPANMNEEQVRAFEGDAARKDGIKPETAPNASVRWNRLAAMLVAAFNAVCDEERGDARRAVAEGLRLAAREIAAFMAERADAVGAPLTAAFVSQNCPLHSGAGSNDPALEEFIGVNFRAPLGLWVEQNVGRKE
ncbi:MAG: L-2-amino-thiazoline-4-carboxylic acid hydrolase [Synergistaceae bacterium]|jgi:hypothetical protein|nr:L-2-amino-thiazoline-4-carboxylic acid hydrolase [Synergistaceae bacterium]